MKRIAILLLCAAMLASCIKEDRTACPCSLHVDLSLIDKNYVNKMDLVMNDNGITPSWFTVDEQYIGDTVILPVNKSEFDFCAWGNLRESVVDLRKGTISSAHNTDTLWSSYHRIMTRCEDAYVTVEPQRRYIPVTIFVRGMIANLKDIQPSLTSVSNSFDFNGNATGNLDKDYLKMIIEPDTPEGYYQFETLMLNQPSATDAGLELTFIEDGAQRRASYPLGKMLYEDGEDITLADGKPIVVDLMLGSGNIFLTIGVADWQQHDVIDIIY